MQQALGKGYSVTIHGSSKQQASLTLSRSNSQRSSGSSSNTGSGLRLDIQCTEPTAAASTTDALAPLLSHALAMLQRLDTLQITPAAIAKATKLLVLLVGDYGQSRSCIAELGI